MNVEQKVVSLRGVEADLQRYIALPKDKYPAQISKIGSRIAEKLNRFVPVVDGKGVFGGFTFWAFDSFDYQQDVDGNESSGLSLKCGDFYTDMIMFFADERNEDCYVLSICGGTNCKSDLWNGFDSELRIVFNLKDENLTYTEVLFVGQQNHHFDTYQFDIEDQAKLKIMSIVDRAMQVFTRMELIKNK